jgi:guanyl-specific ribonuclease Sa
MLSPVMLRLVRIVLIALIAFLILQWCAPPGPSVPPASPAQQQTATGSDPKTDRYPGFLPPEAVLTLKAIESGGPFPYDRDGAVFQNRERRLPDRPRGYYREFTVETPGSRDRGARRIVSGGDPPETYYYTDDHYRSFRRVEIKP